MKQSTRKKAQESVRFAFDVGHSSIGWAAINSGGEVQGCGVVTFPKNDCLASERRLFRRQRRHVRATRARISRIAQLLEYLNVIPHAELKASMEAGGGHSAPWLLAARVLQGGPLLNWAELWNVIRWYAHNRGYDGNRGWSNETEEDQPATEAEEEDTQKVQNALRLFEEHNTRSMAAVFCRLSGLDPLGSTISANPEGTARPKGQNAAFPREDVEREVRNILERHKGHLPAVDDQFIRALMEDWAAIPCPAIKLPARYGQLLPGGKGRICAGLLFGQLIPRFENRIIGTCPIAYQEHYQAARAAGLDEEKARHAASKYSKLPTKDTLEFYRYRWAMQVANVTVAKATAGEGVRPLSIEERCALNAAMEAKGAFTKTEFTKAVAEATGGAVTNLAQLLTHPDADKALILDPARKAVESNTAWRAVYPHLATREQKRTLGRLRKGQAVTLAEVTLGNTAALEALELHLAKANTYKKRKDHPLSIQNLLSAPLRAIFPPGRAPHTRTVMQRTADYVFSTNRHPQEEGGPLFRSKEIRERQRQRSLEEQTNNHLIRHRLLMLDRLHRQLFETYASNDPDKVRGVTIEVNRELRDLSGKKVKEIAKEMALQLGDFKSVVAKVEKDLQGTHYTINASLIRKARIAADLGWHCPYTGEIIDVLDLCNGTMDKDHIIPYSQRPSNSLDSLVVTFREINQRKLQRTAMQFIRESEEQPTITISTRKVVGTRKEVGTREVKIRSVAEYEKAVQALESFKGHKDDKRRKKRRKEWLLLENYVEKAFTPGDLTQTSQLVRLSAQLLERPYFEVNASVPVDSLPGTVTGTVRTRWKLIGCLRTANPRICDPATGEVLSKQEIRSITHLHHALDACVLGIAAEWFPKTGDIRDLLIKRNLNAADRAKLKDCLGNKIAFNTNGSYELAPLPAPVLTSIREKLAEHRVIQHIPADLSGMRVEQNARRILSIENDIAKLKQRVRQADGTRSNPAPTEERTSKLLGITQPGKLQKNKAALVITDNFGLALDPEPQVIPYHKVPVRLRELREKNGGKPVRILRRGMIIDVPQGRYKGSWRVFSIKNNAAGLALDIAYVDAVSINGTPTGKLLVALVKSLLKEGMQIRRCNLVGEKRRETE